MTLLESYLAKHNLPEIETLNRLSEAGLISDNVVCAADVAAVNAWVCVEKLSKEKK